MRKILCADLWPIVPIDQNFGQLANAQAAQSQMRVRQLVENVLLYDQVVIPTDDLVSVWVLAKAFGPEGLALLVDEGVVRFVRFHGALAYVGHGMGISIMKLASVTHVSGTAWQPLGVGLRSVFFDLDVEQRRAAQLAVKFAAHTKEIDLSGWRLALQERTRAAVLQPNLTDDLKINSTDIEALPKSANEVLFPAPYNTSLAVDNEIGRVLRVARTQLEMLTQTATECTDLSTLSPVGKVLFAQGALEKLYEITDVPDFGRGVIEGQINLQSVLALRNSRHWQEFVKWFHEACASDPARVGKEYVRLLKKTGELDTSFFRIVRLLAPVVLEAITGMAGVALLASTADAFLMPRVKGPSAKYFVEQLEQIAPEQRLA